MLKGSEFQICGAKILKLRDRNDKLCRGFTSLSCTATHISNVVPPMDVKELVMTSQSVSALF